MQDELTTILGIKVSPEALAKLNKFKQGLQSVADRCNALSKATLAVGASITTLMKLAGDSAVQLKNLSESTGIATSELQSLEYASKSIGVSFDAVKGDIQSLTSELNNPIPNQFNEGLVLLGVSTRDASGKAKKATDIFNDLADKMKGMSAQKAIAWGKKVGISEDTVKLLRQGKDGLAALQKEGISVGAVVPDSAVNGLAEFSKGMSQLAMIGKSMANTFLGLLAPALNKIIDGYKKWNMQNGGIIRSGIEFIAKQIGKAFDMVATVLKKVFQSTSGVFKIFKPFIDMLRKSNVVASLLTVALGALAVAGFIKLISILKMINPWLLAIAIVVEELYTWFTKGFESTGFYKLWLVFEKKFPTIASGMKSAFTAIKDGVMQVVNILKTLWDITEPIRTAFVDLGSAIIDAMKPVVSFMSDVVLATFNVIGETIKAVFDWIESKMGALGSAFKKVGGFISKVAGFIRGGNDTSNSSEWVDNRQNVPVENAIAGEKVNAAWYATHSVPTGQTVNQNNNQNSITNNNQKVNGTTNVYINAGNASPNEIVGAVKQQYGNSTNINAPMTATGGSVVQ